MCAFRMIEISLISWFSGLLTCLATILNHVKLPSRKPILKKAFHNSSSIFRIRIFRTRTTDNSNLKTIWHTFLEQIHRLLNKPTCFRNECNVFSGEGEYHSLGSNEQCQGASSHIPHDPRFTNMTLVCSWLQNGSTGKSFHMDRHTDLKKNMMLVHQCQGERNASCDLKVDLTKNV